MRKLKLEELERKNLDEFIQSKKHEIILILDNIRSGMNVGSFFRTADAFALEKIILCGISARPPHKEINKTAIGADKSVNWEYFQETKVAILELKQKGYKIIGVEQTDESQFLQDFPYANNEKIALVFGNEVDGISDDILNDLDICLEIPQFGTKHSLNVAVSGGIVVWHILHQML